MGRGTPEKKPAALTGRLNHSIIDRQAASQQNYSATQQGWERALQQQHTSR